MGLPAGVREEGQEVSHSGSISSHWEDPCSTAVELRSRKSFASPAWYWGGLIFGGVVDTEAVLELLLSLRERLGAELPLVLTMRAAALQLSVSAVTLRRMVAKGELETVTVGRRVMVPKSELFRLATPKKRPGRKVRPVRVVPSSSSTWEAVRESLR